MKLAFSYHSENKIFLIDPRFDEDKTLFSKNIISEVDLPSSDAFLICKVEVTSNVINIKSIISSQSTDTIISNSVINDLKRENENLKKIFNKEEVFENKIVAPDDLFISKANWDFINATIDIKRYPLLIGPKGCGKTSTAQAIAKARGMKLFSMNCGSIFKPKQTLVGQMHAENGTTKLLKSEFLKYFTDDSEEGVIIFLDEISRIPTAAANYFMTILDRIQSYIYVDELGERVYKGKNVVFVAAANFGHEYSDTRNIDGALMDRFMKFVIDYLPESEEVRLIKAKVPNADERDINSLVRYATLFRKENETLRLSVSTRQLIDMAEYLALKFPLPEVFNNIFLNLFLNGSMDERDTANKMIDAIS